MRYSLGSLSTDSGSPGGNAARRDFKIFPRRGRRFAFFLRCVFQAPSLKYSAFGFDCRNDPRHNFSRTASPALEGNYYEAGLTKGFGNILKLDINYFRRSVSNYADDDQIDNTTISFPIAFRKAIITAQKENQFCRNGTDSRDS